VNLFQKIEAAGGRQNQVGYDDVNGAGFQAPQSFFHSSSNDGLHPARFRHFRAELPRAFFVFHNENSDRDRGALYSSIFTHWFSPRRDFVRVSIAH
jgi:hypothetical protein